MSVPVLTFTYKAGRRVEDRDSCIRSFKQKPTDIQPNKNVPETLADFSFMSHEPEL